MLTLNLSIGEARILREHLARHIQQMDRELAGTSKHELQHALAEEAAHLRGIEQRLAALVPRGA